MSENSLFPRKSDIFKGSTLDIRDSLARVSLDTLYQVTFSFGKSRIWLENLGNHDAPGKKRTQGTDFKRKMSLLCTQAEIPGTSFTTDLAVGHHQGIQESFPNLRNFPPLNLTFYCDADMVILEVLESAKNDVDKFSGGNKSAGTRLRKAMQEVFGTDRSPISFEKEQQILERLSELDKSKYFAK